MIIYLSRTIFHFDVPTSYDRHHAQLFVGIGTLIILYDDYLPIGFQYGSCNFLKATSDSFLTSAMVYCGGVSVASLLAAGTTRGAHEYLNDAFNFCLMASGVAVIRGITSTDKGAKVLAGIGAAAIGAKLLYNWFNSGEDDTTLYEEVAVNIDIRMAGEDRQGGEELI